MVAFFPRISMCFPNALSLLPNKLSALPNPIRQILLPAANSLDEKKRPASNLIGCNVICDSVIPYITADGITSSLYEMLPPVCIKKEISSSNWDLCLIISASSYLATGLALYFHIGLSGPPL